MEEDNIRILTLLADSIRIRIKTSLKNQSWKACRHPLRDFIKIKETITLIHKIIFNRNLSVTIDNFKLAKIKQEINTKLAYRVTLTCSRIKECFKKITRHLPSLITPLMTDQRK
jgi:hypothetical protein